jgi:branched-chain amino acid transport system permease protein
VIGSALSGLRPGRLRSNWPGWGQVWHATTHQPWVLVGLFVLAATLPYVTQYLVDNTDWYGQEYVLHLATICAIAAALALALNLCVGYAGLFNVGFIAFFGIGAYSYALVSSNQLHVHVSLLVALAVVLGACLLAALLVGIPSLRLRGDYLAIVTFAFALIISEAAKELNRPPTFFGHQIGPDTLNITGGSAGILLIDPFQLPTWFPLVQGMLLDTRAYYWIALGLAGMYAYFLYRWRRSRTGRAWLAIREDEVAARAMGVNPFKYRLLAFAISSLMAGTAGMVQVAWLHNVDPSQLDLGQTLFLYLAIFLGGLGSIPGAILGAIVVTLLPYLLQQFIFYRFAIFGAILVVIMVLRPQGFMGTLSMRPRAELGGTLELLEEEHPSEETPTPALAEVDAEVGGLANGR